jgi:hypothetical protein
MIIGINFPIKLLMAMALAMIGLQAHALPITPDDCGDGSGVTFNCWQGTDTSVDGINGLISQMFPVKELYRASAGVTDVMSLADSYTTTFTPATDPTGASITYVSGGPSITCPTCYLLVKDEALAWYLFDIRSWDGMDVISLSEFWSDSGLDASNSAGPIFYVSLFGGPPGTSVPAPAPLVLLTIGLLLSGLRRLKAS